MCFNFSAAETFWDNFDLHTGFRKFQCEMLCLAQLTQPGFAIQTVGRVPDISSCASSDSPRSRIQRQHGGFENHRYGRDRYPMLHFHSALIEQLLNCSGD